MNFDDEGLMALAQPGELNPFDGLPNAHISPVMGGNYPNLAYEYAAKSIQDRQSYFADLPSSSWKNPRISELELQLNEERKRNHIARNAGQSKLQWQRHQTSKQDDQQNGATIQKGENLKDLSTVVARLDRAKAKYALVKEKRTIEVNAAEEKLRIFQRLRAEKQHDMEMLFTKVKNELDMNRRSINTKWEGKVTELGHLLEQMNQELNQKQSELYNISRRIEVETKNQQEELVEAGAFWGGEEKSRLDNTIRGLDKRTQIIMQGSEIAERRGLDRLKQFDAKEEQYLKQLKEAEDEQHSLRAENASIKGTEEDVRRRLGDLDTEASHQVEVEERHKTNVNDLEKSITQKKREIKDAMTNYEAQREEKNRADRNVLDLKDQNLNRISELEKDLRMAIAEHEQLKSQTENVIEQCNVNISKEINSTFDNFNILPSAK